MSMILFIWWECLSQSHLCVWHHTWMGSIPILRNCNVLFVQKIWITVTPCEQFHKIALKNRTRIHMRSHRVKELQRAPLHVQFRRICATDTLLLFVRQKDGNEQDDNSLFDTSMWNSLRRVWCTSPKPWTSLPGHGSINQRWEKCCQGGYECTF